MPTDDAKPTDRSTTDVPLAEPHLWVERHGDYLYRFALGRVRTPDVAEELVQETFLAAWQGRAGYAGQASERSWLTAILKRKVVDWVRRRVRERAHAPADAEDAVDPFDRRGHWKVSPAGWGRIDPSENLDRDEFWAVLGDCLAKLPPRLHDVFVLRYLDGASGEAVCRELGLSAANLWVRLYRARLRMCACLTVNWFGEAPPGGGRPC